MQQGQSVGPLKGKKAKAPKHDWRLLDSSFHPQSEEQSPFRMWLPLFRLAQVSSGYKSQIITRWKALAPCLDLHINWKQYKKLGIPVSILHLPFPWAVPLQPSWNPGRTGLKITLREGTAERHRTDDSLNKDNYL
jgi:hypothetical protein